MPSAVVTLGVHNLGLLPLWASVNPARPLVRMKRGVLSPVGLQIFGGFPWHLVVLPHFTACVGEGRDGHSQHSAVTHHHLVGAQQDTHVGRSTLPCAVPSWWHLPFDQVSWCTDPLSEEAQVPLELVGMRSLCPVLLLHPFDVPSAFCPQGTPLKYDSSSSSSSTKKHDVRSIIGSPGRTFHPVHSLDVIQDPRNLERAYEESLKNRPSPVTNSSGSIARGAPVIVPEPGKPHQSALAYEEHPAGHSTAFGSHLHRGSPVSTRESTPRQHEGTWQTFYLPL